MRALTLIALLAPLTAGAYSVSLTGGNTGNIVKWPTANLTYYLHPACSADLPNTTCLNEARASFTTWEQVGCTAVKFADQGFSNNLALTAVNGGTNDKNEVGWIENSAWFYGTYTLGVTAPWFSQDGVVFEADIAMNGYLQTWSTSGQNFSTDVRNVLVHEIGHFFGLQHVLSGFSQNDPPTMAPSADPYMASQTPNANDQEGVCFLYPKGAWSCGNNDDCPFVVDDGPSGEYYAGVLSCSGGNCGGFSNQLPEGDAQIGEDCVSDTDCESPLFCQPLQGGYGACASKCQTASPNCPSGFECVPYSNSPGNGVCLEQQGGGGGGSKKANGESCQSSTECESFLCINEQGGGKCRQPCFSANECPSGEQCMPLQGVNYGACFPGEDGGGGGEGKELGENCESGDECKSTLCAGSDGVYTCVQPCINSSQCPQGQQCYGLPGGGGACFGDNGGGGGGSGLGVGDTCEDSSQCISEMCVSIGGGAAFCTDDCTQTSDCPCGLTCQQFQGGQSLCAPGQPVACLEDGAECPGDSACVSGLCHGGVCATACNIFGHTCASGGCLRNEWTDPNGICSNPGLALPGEPCATDAVCSTLFCHEETCAQPCNPAAPACPATQICEVAIGEIGQCVEPVSGTGDTGVDGGTDGGAVGGTVADGGGTGTTGGFTGGGGTTGGGADEVREPATTCSSSSSGTPVDGWLLLFVVGLLAVLRHGVPLPSQ